VLDSNGAWLIVRRRAGRRGRRQADRGGRLGYCRSSSSRWLTCLGDAFRVASCQRREGSGRRRVVPAAA
jgi:hypothetical protein